MDEFYDNISTKLSSIYNFMTCMRGELDDKVANETNQKEKSHCCVDLINCERKIKIEFVKSSLIL